MVFDSWVKAIFCICVGSLRIPPPVVKSRHYDRDWSQTQTPTKGHHSSAGHSFEDDMAHVGPRGLREESGTHPCPPRHLLSVDNAALGALSVRVNPHSHLGPGDESIETRGGTTTLR